MGILNATPDSFSDGGACLDVVAAVAAGTAMAAAGAAWLDVGGESTRPGAAPVPAAEQIRRTVPVIRALRAARLPCRISIDTSSATVAAAALDAGAEGINDISAGSDPNLLALAARSGCTLFLMHMQGTPGTMQVAPRYHDVIAEVGAFLATRVAAAVAAGIAQKRILADPGIGFGKTLAHNLRLLAALPTLAAQAGAPLLVGVSRKSFLAAATESPTPAAERDHLSHLVHARIARQCAMLRVHDVPGAATALRLAAALDGGAHG